MTRAHGNLAHYINALCMKFGCPGQDENTNALSGARMLVTVHGNQTGAYGVQVTKTKVPALSGCRKTHSCFWVSLLVEVDCLTTHLRFGACVLLTSHSEAKASCSIYQKNSGTQEDFTTVGLSVMGWTNENEEEE